MLKSALDIICDKLKAKDYKITNQRIVIIKEILSKQEIHLSAEDIYEQISEINPEIGLATVYRTLELLVELDIINKIEFGDGRTRYEIGGDEHHSHHHLICITCGQVAEFNDDLLENLEEALTKTNGFKVINHQVKFFGICSECQQKNTTFI